MIPVAHGEQAHSMLPGSRFVVFPGAGHEPHVTDPVRFADLVTQHVQAAARPA
jgi:pimeloyl-ACP methyl ester carboxylesterase